MIHKPTNIHTILAASLLAFAFVLAMVERATAGQPAGVFGVRRVSDITTTATTVAELTGLNCRCGVYVQNSTADALNVGGTDVDNSTKFTSVCSSGCDSTQPVSIYADGRFVSVRGASGTVTGPVVFWCAGGCP